MLVVGNLDATTGGMYVGSNYDNAGNLPHVFAPGVSIQCADTVIQNEYKASTGTSGGTE